MSKEVHKAWKAVWDSVLGDIINSAADVVKWVIKEVLTVALLGRVSEVDLEREMILVRGTWRSDRRAMGGAGAAVAKG
ncbi:hypothetical protein GCM10010260_83210 [Streptomyces filipinensis]|uniref:Uncharacterized protein n=1 Tax=Streptomyces filipinensis TaxID=66887 RepID=A0A918MGG4_9ACTN|nr:hypothetical protein GCM10010260_83210 [Streptomyces filipinensis]